MQLLPWHPPTHIHYSVSAQWRWREGYSFVNATPIHVNALPPPQNVRHTSLCALLPHLCLSCSPFLFHYVRWDKKSILFATKKKEKKKTRGLGRGAGIGGGLDSRLLKPPDKLLTTACTAPQTERQDAILLELTSPSSPHCWLDAGAPR